MMLYHQTFGIVLGLAAIAGAIPLVVRNASVQYTFDQITPSTTLTWYPCLTAFYCAVLDVPLDYSYAGANGSRAFVPLVKYPATSSQYKGMLLTNPGGPGDSGIDFLIENAAFGQSVVGSNWDLVAWEPRGIGYSVPLAKCSPSSPTKKPRFRRRGHNKLYGPELPEEFFDNEYEAAQQLGQECQTVIGGPNDAGPHMNTAVVVRDIISILDAFAATTEAEGLKDASLLNYWGFSYGTMIGQTFGTLFPARVGRVILDGVVDPDDYTAGYGLMNLEFTDKAFSTFFTYCSLAGPALCPFYTGNTSHDIFVRFESIISRLNATNAIEQGWDNATAITIGLELLKFYSFSGSYTPITIFPQYAGLLVLLEEAVKNLTIADILELENLVVDNTTSSSTLPEWYPAVACSDNGNILYNRSLEDLASEIQTLEMQSYIGGETWLKNVIGCTGWSIVGVGRFVGPFGAETKNPILFVSNTRDPVTPIFNGRKGTRLFKDAQLLTIDGTGHTSISAQNTCGFAKINAFFQDGVLPGKDNFCCLEAGPFNVTVTGGLEKRSDWVTIREGMKNLLRRSSPSFIY